MHATLAFAAFAALTPSPTPSARVLVVGASGGTGSRALRGLIDVGYKPSQLRVLTRNPSKPSLEPHRELGIELLGADLDDPTTLRGVANGCTGCYVHSTAGDTKKLDTGEVQRAQHLAASIKESGGLTHVVYNSAAAEPTHGVVRIAQKHAVEDVFSTEFGLPSTCLRANLFMEELWKSYTRPPILKGTYPFSLPPDRAVYLTSVRDMGRLAGACLARPDAAPAAGASPRRLNVASELTSPAKMAEAFAKAQGSPCVHERARLLRWIARLFLPDLYEVIQFYRTSTETTDIDALREEFPSLLTPFPDFLEETRWGDTEATYEDLARSL